MKISYVREMRKNYLVAEGEKEVRGYEARMLAANPIQGLLEMKVRYTDGKSAYYYDITSRQPLGRLLESRPITVGEICGLLRELYGTLKRMEEYFLGDGGILLEPEYIYLDPETFHPGLCFVPGIEGNFPDSLSRLLQYLLRHVDHRDRKSVILAYSLYQESLKENYSLEDLLRLAQEGGMRAEGVPPREASAMYGEEGQGEPENTSRTHMEEGTGESEGFRSPQREMSQRESPQRKMKAAIPWRQGLLLAGAIFLVPGVLWIFRGTAFVLENIRWIGAAQAGLLLAGILLLLAESRRKKRSLPSKKPSPYEASEFWEEPAYPGETPEERGEPGERRTQQERRDPGERRISEEKWTAEEVFQTVVLNEKTEENMHRLEGASPEREDIVIPYYPFVIGKHRDLADYVLDCPAVSRLHLRIDREGEVYTVTDLNSTNGTMVRGALLAANETAEVRSGDSVVIADAAYVWR